MTKVKICGLTRQEDAEAAIEFGADALGFVFEPTSPRYIDDPVEGQRLASKMGPYAFCVAVFGSVGTIPKGFQAVQFEQEGDAANSEAAWVPSGILTLRFEPNSSAATSAEAARTHLRNRKTFPIRAVLIEAHHPEQMGGTGEKLDWYFAANFVEKCPAPVILAGGLTPDNVGEAILRVKPYAVDVSSGVESSPGVKDHAKLRDFIQAVQGASTAVL